MKSKFLKRCLVSAGLSALLLGAPTLRSDEGKDGGQWETKMLDHMNEKLELNAGQLEKVKAESKSNREAAKAIREKLTLDMDSLKVLVDKKAGDAELKAAIALVKADHKAQAEQMAKHMEAMAAILTPLQQAKGLFMMREGMERRGMGGEGWHGHEGHGDRDGDKDRGGDMKDDK